MEKKKQFSTNTHNGGQAVKVETITFYDEAFCLEAKKLFCFYTSWHNSCTPKMCFVNGAMFIT